MFVQHLEASWCVGSLRKACGAEEMNQTRALRAPATVGTPWYRSSLTYLLLGILLFLLILLQVASLIKCTHHIIQIRRQSHFGYIVWDCRFVGT